MIKAKRKQKTLLTANSSNKHAKIQKDDTPQAYLPTKKASWACYAVCSYA
jgi:hypothetical protein